MRNLRAFAVFFVGCAIVATLAAGDNPNHQWFWSGWFAGAVTIVALAALSEFMEGN